MSEISDHELHADLTRSIGREHLDAVLSEAAMDAANRRTVDPIIRQIAADTRAANTRHEPQPVRVSFEQTEAGTRMIYLSLTDRRGKTNGKISKTTTMSEDPLVNFDYHADGTLLGIEVIT